MRDGELGRRGRLEGCSAAAVLASEKGAMDVFESRYFSVNRRLLALVGLWPHESSRRKLAKRLLAGLALIGMGLPHFTGIVVNFHEDKRVLLEHMGIVMFVMIIAVKVASSIVNENKLRLLYEAVASNWAALPEPRELDILARYSEMGRTLSLGWLVYIAGATIAYVMLPLSPMLMDIVAPLNASRPRLYIHNGEFLVDREANYAKIYAYDALFTAAMIFLLGACDTMYAACVEHCLGLFAIVRYRLLMPAKLVDNKYRRSRDAAYAWMQEIIKLHNRVLDFTETLESTYEQAFLAIVGLNLVYCSLLCVLTLMQDDNMFNFVRYVFLCLGAFVHLFYLSWPGQKMIDHSAGLHREAYLNEWYECSAATKTLLNVFMQRCSKPGFLTAGRLYIMNFDNFVAVVKKSISFMAVFSSF